MNLLVVLAFAAIAPTASESPGVEMPTCLETFYRQILTKPTDATLELAQTAFHDDSDLHPNLLVSGQEGPGAEGMYKIATGFFGPVVPNMRFDTLHVLSVEKSDGSAVYVHIGRATGTPTGPFFGVDPPTGRSFDIMAMDVHHVVDGKIKETWHVEEWASAVQQLTGSGSVELHEGQPINLPAPGLAPQAASGGRVGATLPKCLEDFYRQMLTNPGCAQIKLANGSFHADSNLHANLLEPGVAGPGAVGMYGIATGFFGAVVPDMKFATLEVLEIPLTDGSTVYVHFGQATGTPTGPFFGVDPPTGRSFDVLAIDVHHVVGGKVKETWHAEEWGFAADQLVAAGDVVLHNGQPINLPMATSMFTCGEIKQSYRESSCCGQPTRPFNLPTSSSGSSRRLSGKGDAAIDVAATLEQAKAGGIAQAKVLAKSIIDVASEYL